jgi:c-di-AMP phosphodiesterase-like protein
MDAHMKRDEKSVVKSDIIFLVIAASAAIIASAACCALPGIIPLYAGMLGVFIYMLVLALYLGIRRGRVAPRPALTAQLSVAGDLTSVLGESAHPTLLCNHDGLIVWCNNAFLKAAGISAVENGTAMEDICLKVTDEAQPEQPTHLCRIGHGLYHYDFVHMPDNKTCLLVTFRNVTELHQLKQELSALSVLHDEEKTAVAYVVIDNIEELLQYIQDKFRSAANEVAAILRDWVDSMGGILRSYERDKFIMLFDKRHLEECVKNRFSILDRIRNVRVGDSDSVPVTVSIGVACIEGTLFEKEQLAQAALDMALQRGGDQVVYKNATGTDYFGGKTKAIYKRANVRARAVGQRILELLAYADNVLIMGHAYGDYDSFGAAVGMARLSMYYGVSNTHIVANRSDPNLRACFDKIADCEEYDDVFVSAAEAPSLVTSGTLLIVVDVNNFPHTECPKLLDMVKDVVIIDHHTQSAVFEKELRVSYIEPSASSASEMVAEILEQFLGAKRLLKEEAELMLSGILLDTKQLIHNTGTRTFGAALFLRGEGADPGETNEFFKNDVADLVKQAQFLTNVVTYKEILAIAVCEGDTDASYRVIAAKAADRLLSGRGIAASFAIVTINGRVHISARSNGTVNVAKILEELHGGGHFDSAGAQIEEDEGEETIEKLKHAIDKYVG